MILIVGLGNPGEKFNNTKHNAGFEALDFFAKKNGFENFELSKKYNALISQKDSVVLVKPQTFMNESGVSVKAAIKNQNDITLMVVHDDIDLPIGSLKIAKERGSAGHKGIESIIQNVGNEGLIRLRIGIANDNQLAEKVVLEKFNKEEQKILHDVIEKSAKVLEYFIENGVEKTMNKYN